MSIAAKKRKKKTQTNTKQACCAPAKPALDLRRIAIQRQQQQQQELWWLWRVGLDKELNKNERKKKKHSTKGEVGKKWCTKTNSQPREWTEETQNGNSSAAPAARRRQRDHCDGRKWEGSGSGRTNRCVISFFQMILDVEFSIKTSREGMNPNQPAVMQRSRGFTVLASGAPPVWSDAARGGARMRTKTLIPGGWLLFFMRHAGQTLTCRTF